MGYMDYRKHQTVKKPKNRAQVDSVCNYILMHEEEDFFKGDNKPSAKHVYYDAYSVMFGSVEAGQMLAEAREEWKK